MAFIFYEMDPRLSNMSVIKVPFVNLENKFSYTRKTRKLLSTLNCEVVFIRLDRIEDIKN